MKRSFRWAQRNSIALLALFFALGGTGYAVTALPKNSVGTRQVINKSLLLQDFKRSSARAVAGPARAGGRDGRNGCDRRDRGHGACRPGGSRQVCTGRLKMQRARWNPTMWARPPRTRGSCRPTWLRAREGLLPAPPASTCRPGRRARWSPSTTPTLAANVDLIASVAIDRGEDLGDCPATHNDARVRIIDTDLTAGGAEQDPGPANARFFIWFE